MTIIFNNKYKTKKPANEPTFLLKQTNGICFYENLLFSFANLFPSSCLFRIDNLLTTGEGNKQASADETSTVERIDYREVAGNVATTVTVDERNDAIENAVTANFGEGKSLKAVTANFRVVRDFEVLLFYTYTVVRDTVAFLQKSRIDFTNIAFIAVGMAVVFKLLLVMRKCVCLKRIPFLFHISRVVACREGDRKEFMLETSSFQDTHHISGVGDYVLDRVEDETDGSGTSAIALLEPRVYLTIDVFKPTVVRIVRTNRRVDFDCCSADGFERKVSFQGRVLPY